MALPTLDIPLVRAFRAVAETGGFTAAGAVLGATQSAISLRIQKLEDRLGAPVLERSPQSVRLTRFGETVLPEVRRLLELHDALARQVADARRRPLFALALSDHAAGGSLPALLAGLVARNPDLQFQITVSGSAEIGEAYAAGAFDAIVVRQEEAGPGQPLLEDRLVWARAPGLVLAPGEPVPLITLGEPCAVRRAGVAALRAAGRDWREVMLCRGVAAVQAAVAAGLGVAALDRRNLPPGCVEVGEESGLPALPGGFIVLHTRPAPLAARVAAAVTETFAAYAPPGRLAAIAF